MPSRGPLTTDSSLNRQIARDIAALFTDLQAARDLGRAYLGGLPLSRHPGVLLTELKLDAKSAPTESLQSRVDALRTADFQSGLTVDVNNWILARTEAELCALTLLLPAGV